MMVPDASGEVYTSLLTWNIDGWFGQSIENKPFIAVDRLGHVMVTDPEGYRVLEFKTTGEFMKNWESVGGDPVGIIGASGVAVDVQGNVDTVGELINPPSPGPCPPAPLRVAEAAEEGEEILSRFWPACRPKPAKK